jgi:two-component system chemotaxis response regulator CheY
MMRMLLKKTIRESSSGDCEFLEAPDGQSALDVLEDMEFKVDAVFCDLSMPRINGIEFIEALSKRDRISTCPVVVVTGDRSNTHAREALALGARACVTKPFTPQVVRGVLVKLFNE